MKNIIFIAPPAAGKGTQSDLICSKYPYEHISTGDMLREEMNKGSELGQSIKDIIQSGGLVTDEIMIDLIDNKLKTIGDSKFILDGFPRTLNQAINLEKLLTDDYIVIYLTLDKEIAKKRILGRLTCKCGKSYNIYDENLKPKQDGICDSCNSPLIKRDDDNEESFNKRFDTFLENNEPIFNYYKESNKLISIDVNQDKELIFKEIEKNII